MLLLFLFVFLLFVIVVVVLLLFLFFICFCLFVFLVAFLFFRYGNMISIDIVEFRYYVVINTSELGKTLSYKGLRQLRLISFQ